MEIIQSSSQLSDPNVCGHKSRILMKVLKDKKFWLELEFTTSEQRETVLSWFSESLSPLSKPVLSKVRQPPRKWSSIWEVCLSKVSLTSPERLSSLRSPSKAVPNRSNCKLSSSLLWTELHQDFPFKFLMQAEKWQVTNLTLMREMKLTNNKNN